MLRFVLIVLLGFVLAVGYILIFENTNDISIVDNLVITVFEKGDKIPADWIKITPDENFKIREFGQRCVLFNNKLFVCSKKGPHPFRIEDIEGEESHHSIVELKHAPCFDFKSWGEYVENKPELQAFKDICK